MLTQLIEELTFELLKMKCEVFSTRTIVIFATFGESFACSNPTFFEAFISPDRV